MYWNPKKWSLSYTQTSAKDWSIPLPVALLVIPVMGGLFVLFLPAAGFYLVGKALLKLTARGYEAAASVIWE